MAIQNEIDRLIQARDASFAAVVEKGGSVPEAHKIEDLPTAVRSIPDKKNLINGEEMLF